MVDDSLCHLRDMLRCEMVDDSLRHLGDMLNTELFVDLAVTTRMRSRWKRLRESMLF